VSGEDDDSFTWGDALGYLGGILSVVAIIAGSEVIGVIAVVVAVIWMVQDFVDRVVPGPDWLDGEFPDYPPQPIT
ncbi:MAG: hypothetical protein Q8M07_25955, partial [Prosthecobacter sp.]|nr:hypothetical protein [Prosthecobacter sp.]